MNKVYIVLESDHPTIVGVYLNKEDAIKKADEDIYYIIVETKINKGNTLKFTVNCASHNPIPYKRTTQNQKFKDVDYHRYIQWKEQVVSEFIKAFNKYPHQLLVKNKKYYVQILIYNKDKTHGDSDNQYKAVLDAIFAKPLNDKYIAGSMDYHYDKNNPRLEIEIRKGF